MQYILILQKLHLWNIFYCLSMQVRSQINVLVKKYMIWEMNEQLFANLKHFSQLTLYYILNFWRYNGTIIQFFLFSECFYIFIMPSWQCIWTVLTQTTLSGPQPTIFSSVFLIITILYETLMPLYYNIVQLLIIWFWCKN